MAEIKLQEELHYVLGGTNRESVTFQNFGEGGFTTLIGERFDYCSPGINLGVKSLQEINGDSKNNSVDMVQMGQKAYLVHYVATKLATMTVVRLR